MLEELYYRLPYGARRTAYRMIHPHLFKRLQYKRNPPKAGQKYTFYPFDKYRCIFVHIPKAAGVSVCQTLFGNLAGGHDTIEKYQKVFSWSDYKRYFKFTFVRNPWDRLASAYRFLRKGGSRSGMRGGPESIYRAMMTSMNLSRRV
ncbi:MAG: sulfotransferase family 2 domain-containing protein [Phycisphaerae bacterium]